MGQYFKLVDFDGHAMSELSKLGEGIWEFSLHRLLVTGVKVHYHLKSLDEIRRDYKFRSRLKANARGLRPPHDQKQSRLLTVLPNEVLRLIFESFGPPNVRDMMAAGVDVASFALTCQLLFEVGHPVLKRYQAAAHNPWSGHRLIIVGDYQDYDDYPAGLEVDPSWKEPEKNIYTETASWPCYYEDLRDTVEMHAEPAENIFYRMESVAETWAENEAAEALGRLWRYGMFKKSHPPPMDVPVLRNLITKEYARGDALKAAQRKKSNKNIEHLSVGDLAAFRIVWSSDPSVSMEADDSLVRGPWAGHRFDIVDMSKVDLDGWKDVSAELIKEVAKIYRDNDFY